MSATPSNHKVDRNDSQSPNQQRHWWEQARNSRNFANWILESFTRHNLPLQLRFKDFERPLLERHCCKEMEVFRSMFAKLTDLSVGWIQVVEKNQPWTPTLRVWLVVVDVTCKLLLGGERQKASTLLHIHSDHLRSSLIPVISENLRNRLRMVVLLFTHTFRDR